MTTEMLLNRYKEVRTHFAGNFGPVNLSGIQHDMQDYIDNAEAEATRAFGSPQSGARLTELNKQLRVALDEASQSYDGPHPFAPTEHVNRDPEVATIVGHMHDMAFRTETLDQVANQPIAGLVIDYMAQLAGYNQTDPLHLTRWGEMSDKLDARIAELEAQNDS